MPAPPSTGPPPPKKKRGRESSGDMVRSLGLVMILVVALWFFAQPSPGDSKAFRDVDPAADLTAFLDVAPGAPVPATVPTGWHATVTDLAGDPVTLRIGYLTDHDSYVEYAAFPGGDDKVLRSLVGADATPVDGLTIDGVAWDRYQEADGSVSLVRGQARLGADGGAVTIVVGTTRTTASSDDLAKLASDLTG